MWRAHKYKVLGLWIIKIGPKTEKYSWFEVRANLVFFREESRLRLSFLGVGANAFHKWREVYDITEDFLKFHLNPTPKFEKALYQSLDSNRKNSLHDQATPESLKLMLIIHNCQDEDPPQISLPLDEECYETTIRSLISALICAVKSDIMFVLEFYCTYAIFDLYQNTCYIETERSL